MGKRNELDTGSRPVTWLLSTEKEKWAKNATPQMSYKPSEAEVEKLSLLGMVIVD